MSESRTGPERRGAQRRERGAREHRERGRRAAVELAGASVVVTGGGHGIGRALAERFAAEGAQVTVADVDGARAEKIAGRIGGVAVTCDVGDRAAMADLVGRATDAHGPVDVFCSNAGILDRAPGLTATREQIDEITRVNLLAHVWAAQEVVPSMVERGGGHLVQTISSAGLISGPADMGYTFTKHGALGFAEWVAVNYAHLGVQGDVPVPERGQHRHDRP